MGVGTERETLNINVSILSYHFTFLAFPMFLTLFVSNEFTNLTHTSVSELCSRVTFRSTLHRTLRTTNPGGALCVCVFTSLVAFRGLRAPGGDLVVYTHRQYTTAATGGVSCRTCSKKFSVFAQVPPKVDIQNSTIFKNLVLFFLTSFTLQTFTLNS